MAGFEVTLYGRFWGDRRGSTHRHLPGMPSAAEVQEKGAGLGEMQVKLLAKIEELTLHLIQAEKRIAELERTSQTAANRGVTQ